MLPAEVVAEDDPSLQRPDEEEVQDLTEKTRQALERLTQTKIAAAMPVRCAEKTVYTSPRFFFLSIFVSMLHFSRVVFVF